MGDGLGLARRRWAGAGLNTGMCAFSAVIAACFAHKSPRAARWPACEATVTGGASRATACAGSPVRANAAHPGLVNSAIYQHDSARRPADRAWAVALRLLAQDPDHGALPVLFAAVADLPGNSSTGPFPSS